MCEEDRHRTTTGYLGIFSPEHRYCTSHVRSERVGKIKANTTQKDLVFTNPPNWPGSRQTCFCRVSSTQLETMNYEVELEMAALNCISGTPRAQSREVISSLHTVFSPSGLVS